jgi:hypothetical protein
MLPRWIVRKPLDPPYEQSVQHLSDPRQPIRRELRWDTQSQVREALLERPGFLRSLALVVLFASVSMLGPVLLLNVAVLGFRGFIGMSLGVMVVMGLGGAGDCTVLRGHITIAQAKWGVDGFRR